MGGKVSLAGLSLDPPIILKKIFYEPLTYYTTVAMETDGRPGERAQVNCLPSELLIYSPLTIY